MFQTASGTSCAMAIAEAQATATKEAQRAGIAAAKSDPRTYRGRKPSYTRAQYNKVVTMLNAGEGASSIQRKPG
jgi:putative DNA-invertase from lambdoid prophage Rac